MYCGGFGGDRFTFALTNDKEGSPRSYDWFSNQILHILDKVKSVLKVRCGENVR